MLKYNIINMNVTGDASRLILDTLSQGSEPDGIMRLLSNRFVFRRKRVLLRIRTLIKYTVMTGVTCLLVLIHVADIVVYKVALLRLSINFSVAELQEV
jgi:hypothetical protein